MNSAWLTKLVESGIAVYAPGDRGSSPHFAGAVVSSLLGEPTPVDSKSHTVSWESHSEDGEDFVRHLQNSKTCIDWNNTGFCGVSLGGYIALSAAERTQVPKFVVGISPLLGRQSEVKNYQLGKARDAWFEILDRNRNGEISKAEYARSFRSTGFLGLGGPHDFLRDPKFFEKLQEFDILDRSILFDSSMSLGFSRTSTIKRAEFDQLYKEVSEMPHSQIFLLSRSEDKELSALVALVQEVKAKEEGLPTVSNIDIEASQNESARLGWQIANQLKIPMHFYHGGQDRLIPREHYTNPEGVITEPFKAPLTVSMYDRLGHDLCGVGYARNSMIRDIEQMFKEPKK